MSAVHQDLAHVLFDERLGRRCGERGDDGGAGWLAALGLRDCREMAQGMYGEINGWTRRKVLEAVTSRSAGSS